MHPGNSRGAARPGCAAGRLTYAAAHVLPRLVAPAAQHGAGLSQAPAVEHGQLNRLLGVMHGGVALERQS